MAKDNHRTFTLMFLGTRQCHNGLHGSPLSPRRVIDSLYFEPENQVTNNPPLRAKRKLDMGDPYTTSVKRAKSGTVMHLRFRPIWN